MLEAQLAADATSPEQRADLRRLSFVAWLSALGLMTMLGVADAADDPLVHSDEELLDTLALIFDNAARELEARSRAQ